MHGKRQYHNRELEALAPVDGHDAHAFRVTFQPELLFLPVAVGVGKACREAGEQGFVAVQGGALDGKEFDQMQGVGEQTLAIRHRERTRRHIERTEEVAEHRLHASLAQALTTVPEGLLPGEHLGLAREHGLEFERMTAGKEAGERRPEGRVGPRLQHGAQQCHDAAGDGAFVDAVTRP